MRYARMLVGVIAFLAWDSGAVTFAAEPTRPNILLLWLDNVGYGDLGCYGNTAIKTPHIDRLAADGVRCTDFYIGSPSCSPSRGALLTGRHPRRNGLNYQLNTGEGGGTEGLPESERIIPQYLKPLGYATGAFGKWNIGFRPGIRPTERGFDEFLGHMSGNIHYFKYLYHGQNDLRQGTEPIDRRGTYSTDLFADSAIDFIRRHRQEPWFVYLPFNAAHYVYPQNVEEGEKVQWQVPDKYLALYGAPPDEPDQKKRFRAVLTALDDAIGRVLTTVDDLGMRERTVVFCISDNGAFMFPNRGLEVQSNRPLRDGGVTTYEGGVRVPAIVRWPGKLPAGTVCREMLSSLDVLPMILAAVGVAAPADRVLDGRDSTETLAGKKTSPHEFLCWEWDQGRREQWRGLREGNFKLVRKSDTEPWQLYDLSDDIGEKNDLAARRPELLQALATRFDVWRQSIATDPRRSKSAKEPTARVFPQVLWKVDLTSASYGGGAIGDLNADGRLAIVFGTYFNDEHLYAVDAKDGTVLWKFKSEGGPFDASVALADLNGDGKLEVLAADSSTGTLFCLSGAGEVLWKVKLPNSTDSPPAVADLDGDGGLEIVVGTMSLADRHGRVVVLDAATQKQRWMAKVPGHVQSEPAQVDLNRDGVLDAIVTTWRGDKAVRALDGKTGAELWSHAMAGDMYHGVSVFEQDGPRIVAHSIAGDVCLLDAAGTALWTAKPGGYLFAPSTVADLDGDGAPEMIVASGRIHVLDTSGKEKWRSENFGSISRGVALADANGDNLPDLFFGASDRKFRVLAGRNGQEIWSYDATLRGHVYEKADGAPLVGDFDGDGNLDVFFVAGKGTTDQTRPQNYGRAFALRVGPGTGSWNMFRGTLRRTGTQK